MPTTSGGFRLLIVTKISIGGESHPVRARLRSGRRCTPSTLAVLEIGE